MPARHISKMNATDEAKRNMRITLQQELCHDITPAHRTTTKQVSTRMPWCFSTISANNSPLGIINQGNSPQIMKTTDPNPDFRNDFGI